MERVARPPAPAWAARGRAKGATAATARLSAATPRAARRSCTQTSAAPGPPPRPAHTVWHDVTRCGVGRCGALLLYRDVSCSRPAAATCKSAWCGMACCGVWEGVGSNPDVTRHGTLPHCSHTPCDARRGTSRHVPLVRQPCLAPWRPWTPATFLSAAGSCAASQPGGGEPETGEGRGLVEGR
eukprot:365655-Chlamydomonas_euryale.AAC.4